MTDTHGLRMDGLREAAEHTGRLSEYTRGKGLYVQIAYHLDDGTITTHEHVSENSWTKFDERVVVVEDRLPQSEQRIADRIAEAVEWREK